MQLPIDKTLSRAFLSLVGGQVVETKLLELRSTSSAGEYQGQKLGLYYLTTDQREESPRQGLVYRQLHCGPGGSETQYYLYR
jgi:hypothetical protein